MSDFDVDALAQYIREIDGNHNMGAGALAENIMQWFEWRQPQQPGAESLQVFDATEKAQQVLARFERHHDVRETPDYSRAGHLSTFIAEALDAVYFQGQQFQQPSTESPLQEIIEIYANMEGFIPETAPEAYLQRIIEQMAGVAREALQSAQ